MTYEEWLWGLDGTTIIDKLLSVEYEIIKAKEVLEK